MTTYPLSEPATIFATAYGGNAPSDVLGRGTLAECVELVEQLHHGQRFAASIKMDALDMTFSPSQVDELSRFLRKTDVRL